MMPSWSRAVERRLAGVAQGFVGEGLSQRWVGEGPCGSGPATEAAAGRRDYPRRPSVAPAFAAAVALWLVAMGVIQAGIACGLLDRSLPQGLHEGTWVFTLTSDASSSTYGASVATARVEQEGRSYRVQVVLPDDGQRYFAHERIAACAAVSPFPKGSFERYAREGLVARVRLSQVRRMDSGGPFGPVVELRRWAASAMDAHTGPGAALLRAIVLGDRSALDEGGMYETMKTVGLAHLVAVSGAHLSVVAAFVLAACQRLRVPRRATTLLLACFYASYAVFTGLSRPVIRAAIMAAVVVFSSWAGRRSSSLNALGVCVCVLLAANPYDAFSLSFFLSVGATFGIIVFAPLFGAWFSSMFGGRASFVTDTWAMTCAANMPIFPVTACVFARLPCVALVSNLLAAFAFTLFLGGGLVATALCAAWPSGGHAALGALCWAGDGFCRACGFLASLPLASIPLSVSAPLAIAVTVAVIALVWWRWPRLDGATLRGAGFTAVAALLCAAFIYPRLAPDEIVMLNVGQGDALLVKSQGKALLIDTGNQDAMLLAALARHGVYALDAVCITHHDDDHCGSLPVLASMTGAARILIAQETFACGCDGCSDLVETASRMAGCSDVQGLSVGDEVRVGSFSCKVVWPLAFQEQGGNADSLCLLVGHSPPGQQSFDFVALFTGDAEAAQLAAMIDAGLVGDIDILKEPHHGSRAGVTDEVAAVLRPEIALISVGENNSYGHPSQDALDVLARAGAQVFRTDENGDVTCRFAQGEVEVLVQRAP